MFRDRSSLSLWGVTELVTWAKPFPEQVDHLCEKAWESSLQLRTLSSLCF